MKITILKLSIFILLLAFVGVGCEKNEDNWIPIDSLTPDEQISTELDLFLSGNKDCLSAFQKDTVLYAIFNQRELSEIDNCSSLPQIDFDKYTLVAGKVTVPGMVSSITKVSLTSNERNTYTVEVFIDECTSCYANIGQLYFWRTYPKLDSGYSFKISIIKTKKT